MGLKDQLEAAGYDTSNLNESDLVGKLSSAGYDTSSLAPSSNGGSEADKLKETIASLESQKVDPSVINAQKQKLSILESGKPMPAVLQPTSEIFNIAGENLAEKAAQSFPSHPQLAAAAGTAIQMIPHIVASLPMEKGAEMGVEGAKSASKAIADTSVGQALRGTGNKAVAALSEKMAELPINQGAKIAESQSLRLAAKKGIQTAEEKAGLGLTQIQGKRELLSDAFAAKMARLADLGPEKLAQQANPETLQTLRKTVQMGFKEGGENAPLYAKANKAFSDALGLQHPDIQDALSKYAQIEQVIKDLPAQATKEKQMLKLALVKARNLAKSQAGIRKTIGTVATVGIGGAIAERLLK